MNTPHPQISRRGAENAEKTWVKQGTNPKSCAPDQRPSVKLRLSVLLSLSLLLFSGCTKPGKTEPVAPTLFELDSTRPRMLCTFEVVPPENFGGVPADLRNQAAESLRHRLEEFFPSGKTSVAPEGENRLSVRLPGLTPEGLELALDVLPRRAYLAFRCVAPENESWIADLFKRGLVPEGYATVQTPAGPFWTPTGDTPGGEADDALRALAPVIGHDLLLELADISSPDGKRLYRPWYVSRKVELDGTDLSSASVGFEERWNVWRYDYTFDQSVRRAFAKLTADLSPGGALNETPGGRRCLAIVFDDRVLSAPYVRVTITGGAACLEQAHPIAAAGLPSSAEPALLAALLRAGPLPCSLALIATSEAP